MEYVYSKERIEEILETLEISEMNRKERNDSK